MALTLNASAPAATKAPSDRAGAPARKRLLITPEGVPLSLVVASRTGRAAALILDLGLLGLLFLVTTIVLVSLAGGVASLIGRIGSGGEAPVALQFLVVMWILLSFLLRYAYFLWFEMGARGATPGKRLVGIRIAARDGGRLTAEMVIARNLLRDIELFAPIPLIAAAGVDSGPAWLAALAWFLLFMLMPCFNRDRLRAGDIVAGTWVVEAPRTVLPPTLVARTETAGGPTWRFTSAELAAYGEYELEALERILREDRAATLESVQAAIARKIGREPGPHDPRSFLEAYYAQLRARLEAGMRMGRRKADKHSEETNGQAISGPP